MEKIIISMILTVFPILGYLVFSSLNAFGNMRMKQMIFIITMFTSLYLNISFSINNDMLIFGNIPIIICYFKKELKLALLLSLTLILYSYYVYDSNIYFLFIKYLCCFCLYLILYKKKNFISLFLNLSMLVLFIFITFKIDIILIYGLTFIMLYLFKIADKISDLYLVYGKMIEENKLKDSLFKLTHEIKNPIAVCKGYLDMINFNDINKAMKYVNIISSEIDRSLNVISEFIDYNKVKINKDIMDIIMLIDEVYDSFKLLVKDKNISFVCDSNYDEIFLMGDYNRLKQVFVNIIKNSIESIERDGIINISVEKLNDQVVVTIKDSGIGMDEEELSSIKQMFFTTKKNGTGLGVALSNEIINAHDGELIYDSVKNNGTTCIVKLPI